VKVKSNFDAYKEGIFTTSGEKMPIGGKETSKYDPEYINKMILEEKNLKK